MHGAEPSELAGLDDPSHRPDVRAEALGMAADELDPAFFNGGEHRLGLLEGNGHRLFHHDMLAALGGDDRVRRVELVRRGDPDRLDLGIFAELLDAVVYFGAVPGVKSLQDPPVDVRPGHELDLRRRFHRRQDLGRPDADPDDAELEPSSGSLSIRFLRHGSLSLQFSSNLSDRTLNLSRRQANQVVNFLDKPSDWQENCHRHWKYRNPNIPVSILNGWAA